MVDSIKTFELPFSLELFGQIEGRGNRYLRFPPFFEAEVALIKTLGKRHLRINPQLKASL
jgi:hypothetical protein